MAKNAAPGHGRLGPIKGRIQAFNPRIQRWIKFSTKTDRIVDVKADGKPFKSVRRARAKAK